MFAYLHPSSSSGSKLAAPTQGRVLLASRGWRTGMPLTVCRPRAPHKAHPSSAQCDQCQDERPALGPGSPSLGLACAGLAFVLTKAPEFPGNLFVPFCLLACLSKHRHQIAFNGSTNAERQHPEPTSAVCAGTWSYASTARLPGACGSPPTSARLWLSLETHGRRSRSVDNPQGVTGNWKVTDCFALTVPFQSPFLPSLNLKMKKK